MRGSVLRRASQVVAVGLLASSASMLLLEHAQASGAITTGTPVLQQAWYWQNVYEQANPPVAQAAPASEPSGVPDGDLAVAYSGNADKSPSKMTALSFDLSALSPGGSVQQFTFSLTVDSQAAATSFNASGATIVACQPTRLWPALMGGDYTDEPSVDCSHKVVPTVVGGTYTFKIPAIAQSWVDDQNLGVALVPDPAETVAPFQVVFKGAKASHGTVVYLPAASDGTATDGGSATSSSAATSGAGPAPAAGGPAPAPLPPTTTGTTSVAAPPPVVAAGSAAAPATKPVAAITPASSTPTGAFWLAGIVVAVVLLFSSLVLGDPTPAPVVVRRSRLSSVRSL